MTASNHARRGFLKGLFGGIAAIGAARPSPASETERITIAVDGRVLSEFVLKKSPFPRHHVIETTEPGARNKTYMYAKTGRYGTPDEIRQAARLRLNA